MASPGDFKGQRRGACGHIIAAFDLHERCARCREKKLGEDPCVKDKPCSLCDQFSDTQKETLSTPSYRIRKERKAGLLVSPKEVTVISPVEDLSSANAPTDNSSAHPSAHPVPESQPSAQPAAQAPAASSASTSDASYVTSDQLVALSDKMSEQFARFEVTFLLLLLCLLNQFLLKRYYQILHSLTLLLPDPPVRCGLRQ